MELRDFVDDFDSTGEVMDSETISIDFDDIDLYGTKLEDEDKDTDIKFE